MSEVVSAYCVALGVLLFDTHAHRKNVKRGETDVKKANPLNLRRVGIHAYGFNSAQIRHYGNR
eukprot:6212607-Pleurochrysis_carterae.AAC.1